MFGWRDFEVKLEQHRDRLRQAEKNRLIKQTANCQKPLCRQNVENLSRRTNRNDQPATNKGRCREQIRLAKEKN